MATCLIADDSKIIRMVLSKIMGNLGFDVIEAEDGDDVIEQWKKTPLELVIMDWRLPVMEGIDVLYMIRSSTKMQQPKILFCSSLIEENKIREALQGGADDYIMKPFDEEIIENKISMLGLI